MNIGDCDRPTPDSMGQTVDRNVRKKKGKKVATSLSNVLDDTGPTGVSDSGVEYGFISQIVKDAGSDQLESPRTLGRVAPPAIVQREDRSGRTIGESSQM